MNSFEISIGNTIVTVPDKRGVTVTGQVLSKGPKNCTVLDKTTGGNMRVPYSLIIASDNKRAKLDIPLAKAGDTVVGPKGEKFLVLKVNSANYKVKSLSDGVTYGLPIGCVTEVLDGQLDGQAKQKAFLAAKGLSEADIADFFAIAA